MFHWLKRSPRTHASSHAGAEDDLFDDEFLRKLETLALASRKAAAGVRRGERRSKKKGSGVEFADHRPYVAGEDIRFLDLSIYQRFGKLLLRVYEEEEDLSLYFLVDCSASMNTASGKKLRQAKRLAAALGYIGLSSLDRVGIISVGETLQAHLPPTRGRGRIFRLLRFLTGLEATGRTDLGAAVRKFVAQHRRRGLAVLLTDLYDPHGFEVGINVLRYSKFDVCVLQITAEEDQALPDRGDLTVVDVETGQTREVTVTADLERRLADAVTSRSQRIERFCASRGVPYFRVPAEAPFDEVVMNVLRRGGLLT